MPNFLINGFSAKAGGGRAIFRDYLVLLAADEGARTSCYFVLSARPDEDREIARGCAHVFIVDVPMPLRRAIMLPIFYFWWLPRLVRRHGIDGVFNFADIVLPLRVAQVYFFDWSYAVYPKSVIWARMTLRDRWVRRTKLALIRMTLRHATITIAQTETMARRLRAIHGLRHVEVIPSPVTLSTGGPLRQISVPAPAGRRLLLCLANYAPHKNIEVLLPLARLLRKNNQKFTIVTTLDTRHSSVAGLLTAVTEEGLEAQWINVGRIEPADVPAWFGLCDALLLPTLLESYGLPFVEAMQHRVSILTSDFDFTRDVCGEVAFYFDPMDPVSIQRAITDAFADETARREKIALGVERVRQLPDWTEAFQRYQECLERARAL
jgi:glycosyltransferase involved in cell wall biosynthesis